MTGAIVGVLILLVFVLGVSVLYLLAKQHAPPEPDDDREDPGGRMTADLLAELRKWQAEAAHWKATAERLQRELDGRQ